MLKDGSPYGGLRQGDWCDEFMDMHRQMNRLFDEALDAQYTEFTTTAGIPAVNISETDTTILLRAELPGMNSEDIAILVQGDVLTLIGNQQSETREGKAQDVSNACRYGSFTRSFLLPVQVKQQEKVTTFHNGVLEVVFPKA